MLIFVSARYEIAELDILSRLKAVRFLDDSVAATPSCDGW